MSEIDLARDILEEDNYDPSNNTEEIDIKIQEDREDLLAEILMVEMKNASNIQFVGDNKDAEAEVREISREILEIAS